MDDCGSGGLAFGSWAYSGKREFPEKGVSTDFPLPDMHYHITWRMSLIMHRKGAGGSRYPGQKKSEGKGKLIRRGLSVHSKNLRIFATPLLVVFVFVRSLAYQFLLAIVLVGQYSRRAVNVVRGDTKAIDYHPTPDAMSNYRRARSPVGPGEPALATQKRHHRKAFEYISKALKIDEEDGGKSAQATH